MKMAISVRDDLHDRATRRAAELGVSRSELFSRAVERYLEQLDEGSVTAQINEALELAGPDDSFTDAVGAGRRVLAAEDEDW